MRKEKDNTEQQISKFVEFRQAIYENGFTRRRDAQFELLDALLVKDQIASFPMLSCSTAFTRRWNDLHARQSVDTCFDVLQVRAHVEKAELLAPLWLAWQASPTMPAGIHVDATIIWQAYQTFRTMPCRSLRSLDVPWI